MGREYTFNAPAYVVFGEGTRFDVPDLLQKWGVTDKVLLVHGKNVKASGLIDDIEESLLEADFKIKIFDKVLPDAPVEIIREGVEFAKKEDVNAVIAIGGGSAIDIAKAIAIMINNKGDILKYAGIDVIPNKRKCVFIAIPTTCGTGSEVTDGGVVYDSSTQHKIPFWDVFAGPDIAVLDPFMIGNLPKHLVAATALDAFAHSAEAYTSLLANPISDSLALGSIEIIRKYTPIAYNEESMDALEMLLTASTMAGMAFNRSNVHVGHAIAHSIGAISHMHHGAACALAMPYVMRIQAEVVPEKVRKIGVAMGIDLNDVKAEDVGQVVANEITEFINKLNIKSLSQYSVNKEDIHDIAVGACKDMLQNIAPRKANEKELKEYLLSVY